MCSVIHHAVHGHTLIAFFVFFVAFVPFVFPL